MHKQIQKLKELNITKNEGKKPNLTKISHQKTTVLFGCTIKTQWKMWYYFRRKTQKKF